MLERCAGGRPGGDPGLVTEEPGRVFEKKYREYLWQSYNRYSHEDTEILVCVEPRFVEIWDEDDNRNAFQIFLDFSRKTAEKKCTIWRKRVESPSFFMLLSLSIA